MNERLFGCKTTFQEELYTTPLDRNQAGFRAREREADRLSREIMSQPLSANLHLREERLGREEEGDEDGDGLDEEDRYGAVVRRSIGHDSGPALNMYGSGSASNVYVPPYLRKKSESSSATAVPLSSPLSSSSQSKAPSTETKTDQVKTDDASKAKESISLEAKPVEESISLEAKAVEVKPSGSKLNVHAPEFKLNVNAPEFTPLLGPSLPAMPYTVPYGSGYSSMPYPVPYPASYYHGGSMGYLPPPPPMPYGYGLPSPMVQSAPLVRPDGHSRSMNLAAAPFLPQSIPPYPVMSSPPFSPYPLPPS